MTLDEIIDNTKKRIEAALPASNKRKVEIYKETTGFEKNDFLVCSIEPTCCPTCSQDTQYRSFVQIAGVDANHNKIDLGGRAERDDDIGRHARFRIIGELTSNLREAINYEILFKGYEYWWKKRKGYLADD